MLSSRIHMPLSQTVLLTLAALAVSTAACGTSSPSEKAPNENPVPEGTARPAPKASPTPKGSTEDNPILGPIASPVLSGTEAPPYVWADGRIACTLNSGSSAAGCKIVEPEIAPQQERRKRFLVESKFGCNAGPLYLALSAGDGEMVLPLKQGKFDSALEEEVVIEGPGPVMLKALDQNRFDGAIIKREKCFLSVNLKSTIDVD